MSFVIRSNHSNLGKSCDLKGQNASPTDKTANYIILDHFTQTSLTEVPERLGFKPFNNERRRINDM